MLLLVGVAEVQAQGLASRYRAAQYREAAAAFLAQGYRLDARPPLIIPTEASVALARLLPRDTLVLAPRVRAFKIDSVLHVRRLYRRWFEERFAETLWAFLGSNTFNPLDTLRTQELRARLQGHYGAPTKTIVEIHRENPRAFTRERSIEFEYWFVVNDTIPIVVMDVNGPHERGLVLATDQRYRDDLEGLRNSFLAPLVQQPRRRAFVDYYFDYDNQQWYLTGFDGRRFLTKPIGEPNLLPGRPVLEMLFE